MIVNHLIKTLSTVLLFPAVFISASALAELMIHVYICIDLLPWDWLILLGPMILGSAPRPAEVVLCCFLTRHQTALALHMPSVSQLLVRVPPIQGSLLGYG